VHSASAAGYGTVALLPRQTQAGGTGPSGCSCAVHRSFQLPLWGGFKPRWLRPLTWPPHAELIAASANRPGRDDQLPPFGPG